MPRCYGTNCFVLGFFLPISCQKCGKQYKRACSLTRHRKFECGKEPQFQCPEIKCSFRCKQPGNLKLHCVRRHNIIINNK